jgi:hypothetical protein
MAIVDTTSDYLRTQIERLPEQPTADSTPVHTSSSLVADSGRIAPTTHVTSSSAPSASSRAFGGPEIAATPQAIGGHTVESMNKANGIGGQYDLSHGIHYSYSFKDQCIEAKRTDLWKDDYEYGYNSSGMFLNPKENGGFMDFQLKPGKSASKAIKAWLGGLTIAECLTSVFAMEFESVRAAIGDEKFDSIFGSENATIDRSVEQSGHRMRITPQREKNGPNLSTIRSFLKSTKIADMGRDGVHPNGVSSKEMDENLIPGHWYYFCNHPKYLLKHPGGAWQGENSLYMGRNEDGERTWSGLGASNKTESHMFAAMVVAYNNPRGEHDEKAMKRSGVMGDDGKYSTAPASKHAAAASAYNPTNGVFKDTIESSDVLSDPAYTIGDTTRKGGFLAGSGMEIDVEKVKAAKR